MDWLSNASSVIIIIAGVIAAITTISNAIGKPIKFLKIRNDQEFKDRVKTIIKTEMPQILETHDLETRKKYLSDREKYLNEIKEEVKQDIGDELDEVHSLAKQYKTLEMSAKDVLREKIVCMYNNNKDQRKLRYFERQALIQYHKDYKAMGGNSYIDVIYARMELWDTEPDDYE